MTKHECFSIIYNVYDYCSGKEITSFEQESFYFNRKTTSRLMSIVESICNLVQSGHFTKRDFIFYLLTLVMQKGKSQIFKINPNNIKKTVKRFSVAQTTADHKLINQLMEENQIKLDDMVKVKEDGKSLIYELFQKNFITVCLILKYSRKLLTSSDKHIILDGQYKTFLKVLNKTTAFISAKGATNE